MLGFGKRRIQNERFKQAAELVVRHWGLGEEQLLHRLSASGLSDDEAHRLIALLPSAFVTPELEAHGMIRHPEVSGRDSDGNWMLAKLCKQPEYVAALQLARRQKNESLFDRDAFQAIVSSSAEHDVLRRALEAGTDPEGGVIATSLVADGIADHFVGPLRPFPSSLMEVD